MAGLMKARNLIKFSSGKEGEERMEGSSCASRQEGAGLITSVGF